VNAGGRSPGRLRVVLDHDDLADNCRCLQGLHSLEAGTVVCHPRPAITATRLLAEDVLRALGKEYRSVEREPRRIRWLVTKAWLVGEGVRNLVVLRAHLLRLRHPRCRPRV